MPLLTLQPINQTEVLRYLGIKESVDEAFLQRLHRCEEKLCRTARPAFHYRVYPLETKENQLFAGDFPLIGTDIQDLFQTCSHVIFLAATLSTATDQLIDRAAISDMTDSMIYNALACAAVEQVCNRAEAMIHESLSQYYFTWRFSPGYGDFPLSLQSKLLEHLDAQRRLGITVTPEHILIPKKTVTALMGMADHPLPHKQSGCLTCNMRDRCTFRKNGDSCHY